MGWPPPIITAPCPYGAGHSPSCVKWQDSCSVAKSVVSDSATPWTAARQTCCPSLSQAAFYGPGGIKEKMGCAWGPRPAEGMSAAVSCSLCEGWGPCAWEAPVDVRMRPAHSRVRPASVGNTEAGRGLVGGTERAVGSESVRGGRWRGEGPGFGPRSQPGTSVGASFCSPPGAPQCSPWGPMGEGGSPGGQVTLQLSLRVKGEAMRYRQPGARLLSLPP